jgi:hypothetical protein
MWKSQILVQVINLAMLHSIFSTYLIALFSELPQSRDNNKHVRKKYTVLQVKPQTAGARIYAATDLHFWGFCFESLSTGQIKALQNAFGPYRWTTRHNIRQGHAQLLLNPYKKVKCTIVQALKLCTGRTAHRGSRGIALLYRHWNSVQAVRPIGGVEV